MSIQAPDAPQFDPSTGTTQIPLEDGAIVIAMGPPTPPKRDTKFDDNLADHLSESDLNSIAEKLLMGIDQDEQSRSAWLENMSSGISLLGLEIKAPTGGTAAASTPAEGTSTIDSPLLLEAVLRFQATARGELLPADGPVKVRNDGEKNSLSERLAQALEKDMNHYLTKVAKEYYPDTDRMLLMLGFSGISFKKGYHDPIKRRPVIASIDAKDLIVSNAATEIEGAGRVTHRILMRPSHLKRMQMVGAYRDFELPPPDLNPIKNPVDAKIDQLQGIAPAAYVEPLDQDREIYECYCEIELPGFEHKLDGQDTGLPLPYKVSIDKSARRILEIRRNWHEDDEFCLPRNRIIAYIFIPGLGFYGIGLLNVLGNAAKAVTAAWRLLLDAGMYANFPGFLYLKTLAKQLTNQFRIPPGGGMPIDAVGNDIRSAVMPLPYKDPSAVFIQLIDNISQAAQRVGGTAEAAVGEGRQDAPVGTTLAMIEQATKLMSAVHKRLHQAQGQEFDMLRSLLMEDPEALWRHNKKSKVLQMLIEESGQAGVADQLQAAEERHRELFLLALQDCELIPAADPNTSSQTERYMKVVAMRQMAMTNPEMDLNSVDRYALNVMGVEDGQSFFKPPPPPGAAQPTPEQITAQATMMAAQARLADAQTKVGEAQLKAHQTQAQSAAKMAGIQAGTVGKNAELQSKERIAAMGVARELVIHNEGQAASQQQAAGEAAASTLQRIHDAQLSNAERQDEAAREAARRMHDKAEAEAKREHDRVMAGIENQTAARDAVADRVHGLVQRGIELRHEARQNSLDRLQNLLPAEAGVANPTAKKPKSKPKG